MISISLHCLLCMLISMLRCGFLFQFVRYAMVIDANFFFVLLLSTARAEPARTEPARTEPV